MKRLKRRRLPRWAKIMRNLLLAGLALLLLYILAGAPAFSTEQSFRRAERQNLIGPAQVLATVDIAGDYYDSLLIADDGDIVILFPVYDGNYRGLTGLYYQEKTGPVTVMPAPISNYYKDMQVPTVVLFDDVPDAQRAELKLSLSSSVNGTSFANDYTLTARREHDGFFLFELRYTAGDALEDAELFAFWNLTDLTSRRTGDPVPAEVRLFDGAGNLIYEQSMVLTD